MNLHKSREVVYIAGPFTAPTVEGMVTFCNAAIEVGKRVRAFGLVPMVPHISLCGGMALRLESQLIFEAPPLTWEEAMVDCRELLQRCDAVLMVEGWERSRGATEERELAKACGIPVFDTFAELVAAGLGVKKPEVANAAE